MNATSRCREKNDCKEAKDDKMASTGGEKTTKKEHEAEDVKPADQNLQIIGEGQQQSIDSSEEKPQESPSQQQHQHTGGTSPVQVSVLYNQSDGNVLFLEGGKDFVDLLMNFLLLPLGSVMKLLHDSKEDLDELGAVIRLFHSVEKMEQSIMLVDKDDLTIPKSLKSGEDYHQIDRPLAPCLENGYVKENLTFTITDELEVFPTSTIKSIALLNELQVKNMADLKSVEVSVDTTDITRLLRASLTSKSVLNYVFRCRIPGQQRA